MSHGDNVHGSKKSYKALSSDHDNRKSKCEHVVALFVPSGNLRIWATNFVEAREERCDCDILMVNSEYVPLSTSKYMPCLPVL